MNQHQAHEDANRADKTAKTSDAIIINQSTATHVLLSIISALGLAILAVLGFFGKEGWQTLKDTHDTVLLHGAQLDNMSNHLDRIDVRLSHCITIDGKPLIDDVASTNTATITQK